MTGSLSVKIIPGRLCTSTGRFANRPYAVPLVVRNPANPIFPGACLSG